MFVKSDKECLGICWWLELHSSSQGYQARAEQIRRFKFSLANGALWIMSWSSPVSSSVRFVAWVGGLWTSKRVFVRRGAGSHSASWTQTGSPLTLLFPFSSPLQSYEFFFCLGKKAIPFLIQSERYQGGPKDTAHDIRAGLRENRELLHIPAKGKQPSCTIKDCFARSAEVWDQAVSWIYWP